MSVTEINNYFCYLVNDISIITFNVAYELKKAKRKYLTDNKHEYFGLYTKKIQSFYRWMQNRFIFKQSMFD